MWEGSEKMVNDAGRPMWRLVEQELGKTLSMLKGLVDSKLRLSPRAESLSHRGVQ
jgi:hypothetical protein